MDDRTFIMTAFALVMACVAAGIMGYAMRGACQ